MPADERPDPLHPALILSQLTDKGERAAFRRQCEEALDAAGNPDSREELQRVLRLWHGHTLMMRQPGYKEAAERADRPLSRDDGGMMLEDYIRVRLGR